MKGKQTLSGCEFQDKGNENKGSNLKRKYLGQDQSLSENDFQNTMKGEIFDTRTDQKWSKTEDKRSKTTPKLDQQASGSESASSSSDQILFVWFFTTLQPLWVISVRRY